MNVEPTMVEFFDEHFYKVGEEYFPSVTTILNVTAKPFLATWRGNIGNREADLRVWESQERGKRIHHAWWVATNGGVVFYRPWSLGDLDKAEIEEAKKTYNGKVAVLRYQSEMYDLYKVQQAANIIKPRQLYSEKIVFSKSMKFAGTVDNVWEIKEGSYKVNGSKPLDLPGGLYVVDLKTGKSIDDEPFMQEAAYAKALNEMGLGKAIGSLTLHTQGATRTGIPGLSTVYRSKEELTQDWEDFSAVKKIWHRKNKNAAPRLLEFPDLITLNLQNKAK